jgi:glutaconate CoA-transferase subunit B
MNYTSAEMMTSTAASRLSDGETLFVGSGPPVAAANLAKATDAPTVELCYESGVIDAGVLTGGPPVRIGDERLAKDATSVFTLFEWFSKMVQGGVIDVGLLGCAQIDRFGNINSTVIGEYSDPTHRLIGSGGACDMASNVDELVVITPLESRRFPESVDFVTSPGHVSRTESRRDIGLAGGGPSVVVTDMAILKFDSDGEMYVDELYPGVEKADVVAKFDWEISVSEELGSVAEPPASHIEYLRENDL